MKGLKKIFIVMSVSCTLLIGSLAVAEESGDAKSFVIAGAGPSTKVVELFAQEFSTAHPGYTITVPPRSIKHKGGLEWVATSNRLFGRTGRPLSEKEHELFPMLVELPLARIKTAFAVSRELGVSRLTLEQWSQMYNGTIKNWKEVGGPDQPIILLGREAGESLLTALQNDYPSFGASGFTKSYTKEDQMLKSIGKIPGAIGFSSKSNLIAREELTVLDIKGLKAGLRVALVYDVKNKDAGTVTMLQAFVQSDQWRKALESHDFLAVIDE